MKRWLRKLHRWGAVITFIPLLLVIVSGLLLQVKKQVPWVQPPTKKGTASVLRTQWNEILEIARSIPAAEVNDWSDVFRLDIRPDRGLIKVISHNHWEIQIHGQTGEVLSSTYRRSDWIEQLHDGSFFSDSIKLWVFLPNGLILLGLWLTGAYLWWLPIAVKLKKSRKNRKLKP